MAAAMSMGASGAWCGSVWLTTAESEVPPVIKKMVAATSVKQLDQEAEQESTQDSLCLNGQKHGKQMELLSHFHCLFNQWWLSQL